MVWLACQDNPESMAQRFDFNLDFIFLTLLARQLQDEISPVFVI